MKVLMISRDKGLVGARPLGDVVERHRRYGESVEKLDIIVLCKKGHKALELSQKVHTYPTNSWFKLFYYHEALKYARPFLKNSKYDLIVTQDPFITGMVGAALKREFGIKLLVHFHGDYKYFFRSVVDTADAVRVMSQGQKDKLTARGIAAGKIKVISTPIDVSRFENFEKQGSSDQKKLLDNFRKRIKDKFTVLMVGRKDKVKDFGTLFNAARIIKKVKGHETVRLWLVGNYTFNDAPRDLIDMIIGEGGVDGKDTPAYYYASNVVVLPSKSESFGKVLVEANACGKPVVATATTGAREIIQDGVNGFLVPVGDSQALAEKILYLIDHPQAAERMGQNGRRMVIEKYGDNLKKVVDFWREIVAQKA